MSFSYQNTFCIEKILQNREISKDISISGVTETNCLRMVKSISYLSYNYVSYSQVLFRYAIAIFKYMENILLQQTDYMTIYRTLRDGLETLVDTRKLTQVSSSDIHKDFWSLTMIKLQWRNFLTWYLQALNEIYHETRLYFSKVCNFFGTFIRRTLYFLLKYNVFNLTFPDTINLQQITPIDSVVILVWPL